MRKISLAVAAAVLCPPLSAQTPLGISAEESGKASSCTFALWVAPSYDYDLQSFWGIALGGAIVGQAVADTFNDEKIQKRRNELEKALPPEAILNAFQKVDLSQLSGGRAHIVTLMPISTDLKKMRKSAERSSEITSLCYNEIYVTDVKANKTLIYGTLFDVRFSIKQFDGNTLKMQYSDKIRRKIPNFPPETAESVEMSYAGVRKIFAEQLEYYLKKLKPAPHS